MLDDEMKEELTANVHTLTHAPWNNTKYQYIVFVFCCKYLKQQLFVVKFNI